MPRGQTRSLTATALLRFALAGVAAVGFLSLLTLAALQRISTAEALRDSKERARLAGIGIVEPALNVAILDHRRGPAFQALDELIQGRVLTGRVLRVKLWSENAEILYSDEHRLIGRKFAPKDDHASVIRTGETEAEIADTNAPENAYERDAGRLLEVYMAVRMSDGRPAIYEQYELYDEVSNSGRKLLRKLALPFALGLMLLWLTQLPLARSLARRVARAEHEQSMLLEKTLSVSERERERIAADLHDTVVQDLAGLTYELAAAEASAPVGEMRQTLSRTSDIARTSMQRLRSSLVELHPDVVKAVGLTSALESLAEPLRRSGVEVEIDAHGVDLDSGSDALALVYRTAQELLRNVREHAAASNVQVKVSTVGDLVRLTVTDDGRGFDEQRRAQRRAEGHMGLELQQAMVARQGGSVRVSSGPGRGTVATVEVPL